MKYYRRKVKVIFFFISSYNKKNKTEMSNTQITSAAGYNTDRLIFSESQNGSIPNTPIQYKRILIKTKNNDGTIGDLIIPTTRLFSFGVSENISPDTQKVNGYVLPLCLWSRDGCSSEEKEWTDTFNKIVEKCKLHLVNTREEIERWDLELNDLKKFNPLYWKKEKGVVVKGTGPVLYSKLIVSRKIEKYNGIITMFYDKNDNPIDPLSLIGKRCYITGAIKIESIFIGNKISLQVKLYECECDIVQSGMVKLLCRKKKVRFNEEDKKVTQNPLLDDEDEHSDDEKQDTIIIVKEEEDEYKSDNEENSEIKPISKRRKRKSMVKGKKG